MQLLPQRQAVQLPNVLQCPGPTSASGGQARIAAGSGEVSRRIEIPGLCFIRSYSYFFALSARPNTSAQSLTLIQSDPIVFLIRNDEVLRLHHL
jgi:hypothetical protein